MSLERPQSEEGEPLMDADHLEALIGTTGIMQKMSQELAEQGTPDPALDARIAEHAALIKHEQARQPAGEEALP